MKTNPKAIVPTLSQPGSRPEPPRSALVSPLPPLQDCRASAPSHQTDGKANASSSLQKQPPQIPTYPFPRQRKLFPLSQGERAGVRASFSVLALSVEPKRRRAAALPDASRVRGPRTFAPASWSAPSPLALFPCEPEAVQSSSRTWQEQDCLANAIPSLSQRPTGATLMSSDGNRSLSSAEVRSSVSVLVLIVAPKRRRAAALPDASRVRGPRTFAPASWSAPSPLALFPCEPEGDQSSSQTWQEQDCLTNAIPSLSQPPTGATLMSSHGNSSLSSAEVRASVSVLVLIVGPKRRRAAALPDASRVRGPRIFAPASWSAPSPLALLPCEPEAVQSSSRTWQELDRLVNALPSLSQRPFSTTIMSSHGNRFPLSPRERAGVRASVHPLRTQPIKTIRGLKTPTSACNQPIVQIVFGKEIAKFPPQAAAVYKDQRNLVCNSKKVVLTWRTKNVAPKTAKNRQKPPKTAIDRADPHFLTRRGTLASLRWGHPTIIGNRSGVVTFLQIAGKEKVSSW